MIIKCILGVFSLVFMGWFAYMSSHLVSEQKAGRSLPLPWEKSCKK